MSIYKRVDLSAEDRAEKLPRELLEQINKLHSSNYTENIEVEKLLLKEREERVAALGVVTPRPHNFVFTPSGASKCKRELYYKLNKKEPKEFLHPYHRRWTRNATAVHEAIQRELLYTEVLVKDPRFKVLRKNGLPAWEENVKHPVILNHNGEEFAILGMMDGMLTYKDGSTIGLEIKTKSTTIASVGNYMLRKPSDSHLTQATAYSLLFGIDEYIFLYESLAKDSWGKGDAAKPDIRTFYHRVSEEDRQALLDKFADVVKAVKEKNIPDKEEEKCTFCQYKHLCSKEAK